MRKPILAHTLAGVLSCTVSIAAQQSSIAPQPLKLQSGAEKRSTLVRVIRHELRATPDNIAEIIGTGLLDLDAGVREVALAAVVSRAAGPRFAPNTSAAADWSSDRSAIQKLRPQVIGALKDKVDAVRVEAITALASLDFDGVSPDIQLSSATQRILVSRFYEDISPMARARIVAGFSTDPSSDSADVKKLLVDAFSDTDHRVRHAASPGALKLGTDGTVLLIRQLTDTNRAIRLEAVSMLAKIGPGASDHVTDVEEALQLERDVTVQERLRFALSAMKGKR